MRGGRGFGGPGHGGPGHGGPPDDAAADGGDAGGGFGVRRTLSELADAMTGEAFDPAKTTAAGDRRVASAQRLRDAVGHALSQIHALLNPDQRGRLAYLIRTGVLAM